MARRRMYGSAISFIAIAVMTRVGHTRPLQGVLQGEAVHHGRQHPDVVAGGPVHAPGRGGEAAEDVAAADDDADLDAQRLDLGDLPRDERAELGIDAVLPLAQQRLARQLEQDAPVAEPAGSSVPAAAVPLADRGPSSVTCPPRARSG